MRSRLFSRKQMPQKQAVQGVRRHLGGVFGKTSRGEQNSTGASSAVSGPHADFDPAKVRGDRAQEGKEFNLFGWRARREETELHRNPTVALRQLNSAGGTSSTGESVYFLGSRFDTGSIEEVACNILTEVHGTFKYVVTPNVHHIVRLHEDPARMQPLYERAWRVLCDSRVLSRLAWFSGRRLPVITGSDLTAHLIGCAAEQRLKIAVVGPTADAGAVLRSRYPGLNVVVHTLPIGFIKSKSQVQKCVDFVVKTQASLVFLAVGMPQQEILANHIADHPQARGVGLCIGASIDFLTGKQRRAPVRFQKAGLEWLYRLLSDPRRLAARYLIECPRIFYLLYLEWKRNR